MGFATTHFDTVLFLTCLAILGALLLEMPSPTTFRSPSCSRPSITGRSGQQPAPGLRGPRADRRAGLLVHHSLATAQAAGGPDLALGALPILLYVGVGWTSEAGAFGPVHKFRSMLDPKADTSTLWRELENSNLVFTYHESPLLGLGYGRPFHEHIKLPDVTGSYELEPYVPHNGVLGLWTFGGLLGFSLLWASSRWASSSPRAPTGGPRRRWNA